MYSANEIRRSCPSRAWRGWSGRERSRVYTNLADTVASGDHVPFTADANVSERER
jgi:hypothetical protein